MPWVPPGRALHLHDVENLAGGPSPTAAILRAVRRQVTALAPPRPGDHVIAGCNPSSVPGAAVSWFGCRWVGGHGRDGADDALLATADADDVAARYYRVVIGSGDHAFTDLALELRQRGVEVWVLARRRSVARRLLGAAHLLRLLPDDPSDPVPAVGPSRPQVLQRPQPGGTRSEGRAA